MTASKAKPVGRAVGVCDFASAEINIMEANLRYAYENKIVLPPSYFSPLKSRLAEYDKALGLSAAQARKGRK